MSSNQKKDILLTEDAGRVYVVRNDTNKLSGCFKTRRGRILCGLVTLGVVIVAAVSVLCSMGPDDNCQDVGVKFSALNFLKGNM